MSFNLIPAIFTGSFQKDADEKTEDPVCQITCDADGKDADYKENPTSYQIKKGIVTNKTKMSVKEARSGGFALSLIEAAPADKKTVKKWK